MASTKCFFLLTKVRHKTLLDKPFSLLALNVNDTLSHKWCKQTQKCYLQLWESFNALWSNECDSISVLNLLPVKVITWICIYFGFVSMYSGQQRTGFGLLIVGFCACVVCVALSCEDLNWMLNTVQMIYKRY